MDITNLFLDKRVFITYSYSAERLKTILISDIEEEIGLYVFKLEFFLFRFEEFLIKIYSNNLDECPRFKTCILILAI